MSDEVKIEFTDERPVHITEKAVAEVSKQLQESGFKSLFLRLAVVGGGCSGYQYAMDPVEDEGRPDDTIVEFGELKVFIDSISVGYLKGTTIDFVTGLQGTGFKFINPNAKRTCGCGSSFS